MTTSSKWTQPAEILAILGVVFTLIFLIVEIRENTAAVRTESYGQSIDRLNEWRLSLGSDKELTRIFLDFQQKGFENFDEIELQQLNFIYGALWSIYEAAYYAQGYETMGAEEWGRHQSMICRQYRVSTDHDWWKTGARMQFTPEFLSWVRETCDVTRISSKAVTD
ncbi:MAG: hypothetical protein ACI9UU_003009 [Candidatus Azotimanducaceae bacterium]|jgi:hypothetical protein